MTRVLIELNRILKKGGPVAFEVGAVGNGKIQLENSIIECALEAWLDPLLVAI